MQCTGQVDLLLSLQLRTCYAFLFRFSVEISQRFGRAARALHIDAGFGESSSYKLQ